MAQRDGGSCAHPNPMSQVQPRAPDWPPPARPPTTRPPTPARCTPPPTGSASTRGREDCGWTSRSPARCARPLRQALYAGSRELANGRVLARELRTALRTLADALHSGPADPRR
jgi:hypothetical protein